jgi:putative Holliday junction resolvase
MRIMGVDAGARRIGVAISDESRTLAQAHSVIRHTSRVADAAALAALARENEVSHIVFGNPLLLSGRTGEQSRSARRLGDELARQSGLPVTYWDERLTTAAARRLMRDAGVPARRQASLVDSAAAELILQSYLDWLKREQPGELHRDLPGE